AEALEMFYPNLSKDYINVPTGHFYETEVSYIDPSGNIITAVEIVPEFFQIRVRGTLKAAWNGVYEGTRSGGNFTTKNINDIIKTLFEEVSPINIRGNTAR
ncbi:hypothetical protein RZS08_57720, partial [Arthrospira platensis SPKY1]|nr:hypothetical protein [Arthrospira platensis SPKY1]